MALRHVVTIEKSRLSIPLEKYGIAYSDRQQAVDTVFDSFYGICRLYTSRRVANRREILQPAASGGQYPRKGRCPEF